MKVVKGRDAGRARTGRPLSFDRGEALKRAMFAFWRQGYETTSISDLTREMGISAPSLYGTFGDKKRLFLEVVELYAGDRTAIAEAVDAAPNALDAARTMLTGAVASYTGETTPPGCLLASATATGSPDSADVRDAVASVRASMMALLRRRILRDIEDGLLPCEADPDGLSGLIIASMQGLSVLARDGWKRPSLLAIVDAALAAWPHRLDDPHRSASGIGQNSRSRQLDDPARSSDRNEPDGA